VATIRKAVGIIAVLAALMAVGWYWLGRVPQSETARGREDAARPRRGGELVVSLRSEPANYNRYFEASAAADLVSLLTHARLVRVNRATDELEPALAESWTRSDDGLTYTLRLRPDVTFSDGAPLTSADVVFSFRAAVEATGSVMRSGLISGGKPIQATAVDDRTVSISLGAPNPGLRLLDNLTILPRHKLEAALASQTMKGAWTAGKPLTDIAGLGPFVLIEHAAGQRLVFQRNERYWRRDEAGVHLPYLDKLTVLIIPDQNAEALRLESGGTDLMSNGDIRPEDYARFKRLSDDDRLRLIDAGGGLDPNVLWFNLATAGAPDPKPWLRNKTFRQALSYAVDRQAIANTVYLGAADPLYGPITPRNTTWYSQDVPAYPFDADKARGLLGSIGLLDRNGDGQLEDAAGQPVRFSMLIMQGVTIRERTAAMIQEQLRAVGVGVDIVPLDLGGVIQRWLKKDYDAVLHGFQASATDPLMNLDFWLSSGNSHFWNPGQPHAATDWEARIDELMQQQATAATLEERQRLFLEAQRIFGDQLPALYFVAPRVTLAVSPRVVNPTPAPQIPQLLWSADTLGSVQ
jgi:peptide/nickel transport system substrate-binding protein